MKAYSVDILILGGGVAAQTAAQTARECMPHARITMISREFGCTRPLLTKAGLQGIETVCQDITQWQDKLNISVICDNVNALISEEKCVHTQDAIIYYDKCIYALGSEAFLPPFPGAALEGVYTIRTAADVEAIKRSAVGTQSAVIIGGGVIGIEAGEILAAYGLNITILETQPYLMPRLLDKETADEYQNRLKSCQVETGISVKSILGEERVTGVELADGRIFPCGIVIVSCGVRANTSIAAAAGLETQRGVVVSERMETSREDIYACGDCAQYQGMCPALWETGIQQGRVAGMNACGQEAVYKSSAFPVMFYSPAASLFALGELKAENGEVVKCSRGYMQCKHMVNPRNVETYSRRVYRNGKLVGAALIGDLSSMAQLQKEIAGEAIK